MSGILSDFFHSLFTRRSKRLNAIGAELERRGYSRTRLERVVGYAFRSEELFVEALMHRSFLPFLEDPWLSNERLEFLGDSVLNMVVAEDLYRRLPESEEGDLTKARARLVNRRILAETGRTLGVQNLLLMSSSATQSLEQGSESMIADAYEALVGAIFLDAGMDEAREFIHRTILVDADVLQIVASDDNHKSALLEYAQSVGKGMPRYEIIREDGPEHDRQFTVEVRVDERRLGVGSGRSKKAAEQAAAREALEELSRREEKKRTLDNRQ